MTSLAAHRWGTGATAVLLAGVLLWVTAACSGSRQPTPVLSVTAQGGAVLTSGHGFPASRYVEVSARAGAGSGSGWVKTDGDGAFSLAFRPPAGFTGHVTAAAVLGKSSARGATDVTGGVGADAPSGPAVTGSPGATAGSSSAPVPMTGAPLTPVQPVAPQGQPTYRPPAGIPADCSVEVSAALNTWLATVPDNSYVEFPPRACYWIDDALSLTRRTGLVIEGNGSTFQAENKAKPRTERAQWRLDYGSGITLRDMTLRGANPQARFDEANEFDHNVFIRGTHGVLLHGVHASHAYGDSVSIAQGVDGSTIPSDVVLEDGSADTIGRNGVACVACDGVTVRNYVFNDIAQHVFDLEIEGDGRPGRNVTFTDNTVEKHQYAMVSVGTPFQTHGNDLSDVRITGNRMTEPGLTQEDCMPAVSFLYSKIPARDVVITGNSLLSRTDAVMVRLADGVTIRDNQAVLAGPVCGNPVGIRTSGVSGADVGANTTSGYRVGYQAQ